MKMKNGMKNEMENGCKILVKNGVKNEMKKIERKTN